MAETGTEKACREQTGGKRQPERIFYNLQKIEKYLNFNIYAMEREPLYEYMQRILELAHKWRTASITTSEYAEFNNWYYALEETDLGEPTDLTVEKVEKRLHELLFKRSKPNTEDGNGPSHPWHE